MSRFYHVVQPNYARDGKLRVSQEPFEIDLWRVEFSSKGLIPARSAADALVIAKALGHPCPIVEKAQLRPEADHAAS